MFRFRLSTALLIVTAFAVAFGFYGRRLYDFRSRQDFLYTLYEHGGFATACFDSGSRDGSPPHRRTPMPELELGGKKHVERFYLADMDLHGMSLAPLRRFGNAFFVSVNNSKFDDDQLLTIARIPNIQELQMNGTNISDATIRRPQTPDRKSSSSLSTARTLRTRQ